MAETLVVIPTYCERQTLPKLVEEFHATYPDVDLLVVDDCSPDGTGEWAREYAIGRSWVRVLHRAAKSGLASAYLQAFTLAIEDGYRYVGQLDADGSHHVSQWGRLRARMDLPDRPAGTVGSRWVRGGSAPGWNLSRKALSRLGNGYIRTALGIGILDATAGYRLYRTDVLASSGVLGRVTSNGYGFQMEMTYLLEAAGFSLAEVPVTFTSRTAGESKLSAEIMMEELCHVSVWGAQRAWKKTLQLFPGPIVS